jgi:5-methylthioadenosine/S-adenosylhomocysteine deaminase
MAIEMATISGAQSILMDHRIESNKKDKRTDILLLNATYTGWVQLINGVNNIVFSAGFKNVDTSMVDGEIIMENGNLRTADWICTQACTHMARGSAES